MNTTMGKRGVVWKTPDITADGLKMFACITMLIQTIGVVIVENGMIHLSQYTQETLNQALQEDSHLMMLAGIGSMMQLVGGLAVPIFAFLLVEGFRNTSSYKKYLLSMLIFALASEIPYDFAMTGKIVDLSSQNALVSMTICLMMLYFLQMMKKQTGALSIILQCLIVFGAVIWVSLFRAEFGFCMVLLTAIFYLFYTRNVLKTLLGVVVSLLYVTGPISFYGIWCYTGERKDRLPKYAYYLFYPLHLLVLGMIVKIFMS
ncbi:MAG: conjugal transfer protein TraX [Robinsoniella sp.]|nr:conjugal transfer protein TraX [Robinsoniella sp.]